MRCHAVDLLCFTINLDGLITLVFASREGFFVFMGLVNGILLGVFLEYFLLLRGVAGVIQHTFFCHLSANHSDGLHNFGIGKLIVVSSQLVTLKSVVRVS